jgi:hypothetical protein
MNDLEKENNYNTKNFSPSFKKCFETRAIK